MNAITTSAQPESASSRVQLREIQRVMQFPAAVQRPGLETELSDIIGRVATGAIAEAQAAVARSRAADQAVLDAARTALEQQTHLNNNLSASLERSERLIEELRGQLDVERDNTRAATEALEAAQKARGEQVRALQAELEAARAALVDLQQQYEREAAGRARAMAALKTIQQACALVDAEACGEVEVLATASDDGACEEIETDDAVRTPVAIEPEPEPVAPPPHLAEYLRELFEQIKATYIVDLQTHAMAAVVDRLAVNVRHARDVFVQRAGGEGLAGGELFDHALSAKLHEFGATTFGRHLSIVAYDLAHPGGAAVAAAAS